MKPPLTLLALLLVVGGCSSEKTATLRKLEVFPLSEAFKNNKINGFTVIQIDDSIKRGDSVLINESGYVIAEIGINKFFSPSRWIKYDSLDRKIEEIQRSDITNHFLISYNVKDDMIEQIWEDITGLKDTIPFIKRIHQFDNNLLIKVFELRSGSEDTLNITSYTYVDNLIRMDKMITENSVYITSYSYNKDGLLETINTELNGKKMGSVIISIETGLPNYSYDEQKKKYIFSYF
jgi:hypothetical protein